MMTVDNEKLKRLASELKIKKELLDGAEKALCQYPKYSSKRESSERRIELLTKEVAQLQKDYDVELGQTVMFKEVL